MKRSPLVRRTPLRNRKPLVRSKLKQAGNIPRRARSDVPLSAWCEAEFEGVCSGRAEHRHHILRRAQGGGDEATNAADLCHRCHEHVHHNVAWAYEAGWLRKRTA